MGTPYNPIIDSELTAPLELPAVPGGPLTTQGGSTLDDGSGNVILPNTASVTLGVGTPEVANTFHVGSGGQLLIDSPGVVGGAFKADSSGVSAPHVNPNPTTPALPANPPVSGTVYQNTTGGPIIITVPITATAVGGSGQWALGSTSTPGDWGGAEQIGVSGEVHNMTLYVPNNWYWSITATSATIGTASVLGL